MIISKKTDFVEKRVYVANSITIWSKLATKFLGIAEERKPKENHES